MLKLIVVLCALLAAGAASAQSGPLQARIEAFIAKSGKKVDFDHPRPPVHMEDRSNGKGAYISKWDGALGAEPTKADGFTDYELHVLIAQRAPLQGRVNALLAKRGKAGGSGVTIDNGHIARWDAALGPAPAEADGFTDHELHRIKK